MEIAVPVVKEISGTAVPELSTDESMLLVTPDVTLALNDTVVGAGSWHLGSQRLYWISKEDPETANFSLPYPSIVLHATSEGQDNFPKPCLYCQVDFDISSVANQLTAAPDGISTTSIRGSEDDSTDCSQDGDREDSVGELRFVPADPSHLKEMFQKLTDRVSAYPDPDTTGSLPSDRIIPYFNPDAPDDDQWFTAGNLKFANPNDTTRPINEGPHDDDSSDISGQEDDDEFNDEVEYEASAEADDLLQT